MFSDFSFPLDDPIHPMNQQHFEKDNNNFYNGIEAVTSGGSFIGSPSQQPPYNCMNIDDLNNYGKGTIVNKKLDHNASERDRRKKVNSLYASLRSLIAESDQKKKLSVPAIVSQVLKYIPEIQNEVERLVEKKEALSRKMCIQIESNNNIIAQVKNKQKADTQKSFFVGTINQLSDEEIVVQISTLKFMEGSFSENLVHLEQEGLKVLNMSSFESYEDRIIHNLHFQLEQRTQVMDLKGLRNKLLAFYGSRSFE